MKKLTKFAVLSLSSIASLTVLNNAYSTSYQIFADLNFANPAALNSVKQGELVIGGTTLFQRMHFDGSVTAPGFPSVNGSTTSNTTDELPYGRIAMRVAPKVVVSLDITQPYFTDIQYPANNFANVFATSTFIRDTNYSPKISYQVTERLALGAGLDFNNMYNGQLNFFFPPFQMTNKADSWGTGWDVGIFYMLPPGTFLSLAYYSLIVQHAKGESDWGPFVNNNFSADVKLPATWILNAVQMLSAKWALSGTVRYTQWDTVRYTVLQQTALGGATLTIPDHFYNNASYELATHYQLNNCWGVLAAFDYEPNVQPTYTRNIGLPTYTRYIPAVGAEYEVAKGLKAKLIYAHVLSRPPINMNIVTGQHIQGTEHVNADAWDFSLTYDV